MKKTIKKLTLFTLTIFATTSIVSCSSTTSLPTIAGNQQTYPVTADAFWASRPLVVWTQLQGISQHKLADMQSKTNDPYQTAWIQLAIINKQKNITTQAFANKLLAWHERNPSHPANQLLPKTDMLRQLQALPSPNRIAILIPQDGPYSAYGKTVREGFLNAYYTNQQNKQNIKFYNTSSQNIAAIYQQAITDGADIIVGPLSKEHVQQLKLSSPISKPTLALNYSEVHGGGAKNNFYEFGLLPEDEISQISNHAYATGKRRAIIIASQSSSGKRLADAFSSRWSSLGGNIQELWFYNANTDFNQEIPRLLHVNPSLDKQLSQQSNDKDILQQQRRQDFDIIFLFGEPQAASTIVPLLRFYYANNIPIYASSSIYERGNITNNLDLDGVTTCDIPGGKTSVNRLFAVGQDAYLLSQSMERLINFPNFPLQGSTGVLILSAQHQIHRQLPCSTIHHGTN